MVCLVKIGGALIVRKILACAVIFIVGIACALMLTYGPLHAQSSAGEGDIMAKLDEILRGQADVAAALGAMKEDLRIIKIRVTQSQ